VTRTDHALAWAYLLAALLTMHCSINSAHNKAPWYAAGLAATSVLLTVSMVREYIAADERRAAAVKAERAARPPLPRRTAAADAVVAAALTSACCERWWTSAGAEHDRAHCTRTDQTA
jgi:hypothetical protein